MDDRLALRIRLFREGGQVRPEVADFVTAELTALAERGNEVTEQTAGMLTSHLMMALTRLVDGEPIEQFLTDEQVAAELVATPTPCPAPARSPPAPAKGSAPPCPTPRSTSWPCISRCWRDSHQPTPNPQGPPHEEDPHRRRRQGRGRRDRQGARPRRRRDRRLQRHGRRDEAPCGPGRLLPRHLPHRQPAPRSASSSGSWATSRATPSGVPYRPRTRSTPCSTRARRSSASPWTRSTSSLR